jgi:ABC-2 type transport system permease protein
VGFLVREVFRGIDRGLVMAFVYVALYKSSGASALRGWTLQEMIAYLILATIAGKLLFHDRALDLSDQIFEGYITKFVVMPFRYFTMVLARWIQFMAVQGLVVAALMVGGRLLLARWWPDLDLAPAAMALVLVVLGSYCFLLLYFILHALAFWLDVTWTLLGMTRMICGFVMGELVPISLMPHAVEAAFRWLFPYWTLCGPIEIALGRQDSSDFARGLAVQLASILILQALAALTWRRGLRRYGGAGA